MQITEQAWEGEGGFEEAEEGEDHSGGPLVGLGAGIAGAGAAAPHPPPVPPQGEDEQNVGGQTHDEGRQVPQSAKNMGHLVLIRLSSKVLSHIPCVINSMEGRIDLKFVNQRHGTTT